MRLARNNEYDRENGYGSYSSSPRYLPRAVLADDDLLERSRFSERHDDFLERSRFNEHQYQKRFEDPFREYRMNPNRRYDTHGDFDDMSIGQTTISSRGLTVLRSRPHHDILPAITDVSPQDDFGSVSIRKTKRNQPLLSRWVAYMFACNGCVADVDRSDTDVDDECAYTKIVDQFGNIYYGQTNHEGLRNGFGSMTYSSTRNQYEGHWFLDKPHGIGKLSKGDGQGEFMGLWSHGVLQSVKQGKCDLLIVCKIMNLIVFNYLIQELQVLLTRSEIDMMASSGISKNTGLVHYLR